MFKTRIVTSTDYVFTLREISYLYGVGVYTHYHRWLSCEVYLIKNIHLPYVVLNNPLYPNHVFMINTAEEYVSDKWAVVEIELCPDNFYETF